MISVKQVETLLLVVGIMWFLIMMEVYKVMPKTDWKFILMMFCKVLAVLEVQGFWVISKMDQLVLVLEVKLNPIVHHVVTYILKAPLMI